jgi:hypothetical protein
LYYFLYKPYVMDKHEVKITINVTDSGTIPNIHLAEVLVETETGSWPEVVGSPGELQWFLRGLKCMAATLGRQDIAVEVPGVPREMLG